MNENIAKIEQEDEKYMRMALNEAERALAKQEANGIDTREELILAYQR